MQFPENLKYTEDHEWVQMEGEIATVGITDFAQGELGDIVYVEVDTLGETLGQGEVFGTVEAVKTTSDLFMPLAGEVLEFNPVLDEEADNTPEAINEEPYGKGWIIKIKVADMEEVNKLMDAGAYEASLG